MSALNTHNWWEGLGVPQYGGELVIRANSDIVDFDPYRAPDGNIHSAWMERLVSDDWTLDPDIFDYKAHWRPPEYQKGQLAASWEFTDAHTYVVHLRRDVHWQNIPPVNGREFIADDVVFHFNRMCGLGDFTRPGAIRAGTYQDLISVTSADRYTVVFKWKTANQLLILEALQHVSPALCLENPEAVRLWGDLNDWHHAVGTGPFILSGFVPSGTAELVKNVHYWAYDERYPAHKLPYLDGIKFVMIPDEAEAAEAMRLGKIDIIDHISPMQAYAIKRTNPEVTVITHPDSNAMSIEPRNDRPPFNDIHVRKAMQMAIDLNAISRLHYQGIVDPYPSMLTSRYMTGWGFPYEDWPPDLKDQYAYNPAAAQQLLAEAGYPRGFKTNIVVDESADLPQIETVKRYLAQIGVNMAIRVMKSADWTEYVQKGKKHDQLVCRPGGPLGHTSAPFLDVAQYQKDARNNWAMVDDPEFDQFQLQALAAGSSTEMKKVVREANEYVARRHFSISLLQPMAYSVCQPWVKGFNGQFGSAWAHAGGPAMLSFYLARFWIDFDVKNKMGH